MRILLALYLSALSALSAACSEKYRLVEEELLEEGAAIRMANFKRQFSDGEGQRSRRLEAKDAYVYSRGGFSETRIIFYDFTFYQYKNDGRLLYTIQGGRGELDSWRQWIFLQKGARFQDQEGNSVEAGSFRYDLSRDVLEAEERVIIRSGENTTVCLEGVVLKQREGSQLCRKPEFRGRWGPQAAPGLKDLFS